METYANRHESWRSVCPFYCLIFDQSGSITSLQFSSLTCKSPKHTQRKILLVDTEFLMFMKCGLRASSRYLVSSLSGGHVVEHSFGRSINAVRNRFEKER